MKILISPAKSLDYETAVPTAEVSIPQFLKEAKKIDSILKGQRPSDIKSLMNVSDALADLNWQRNQERTLEHATLKENVRQAVFAFNGDVYTGLDAYTLGEDQIGVLQEKLRILSGLYGLLKPLDLIEPYRLEMGTKLGVGKAKDLYAFWKPVIADALNKEMKDGELLLNLASNEYFSAVDISVLKGKLMTPEFKEFRDGKLKTISFYAKKARGLMVRYILDEEIETTEGLKEFNRDNYKFNEAESTGNKLVFTR